MAHIDYYLGTVSPNCYLAGTRPAEIAAKHGATLIYKPIDLMALFSRTGGLPPPQRHVSRQEYRLMEMDRAAKLRGEPINLQPAHWPTNPAPSSYAVIAAQTASLAYNRGAHIQCRTQEFLRGLGYQGLGESSINALGIAPALAVMSGLGELSRLNRVITPEYGPMVRVFKMITDLPLAVDTPIDAGIMEFCKICKKCAEACPPAALSFDDATWARARGWALWKGLIMLAKQPGARSAEAERSKRVVDEVVAEHRRQRID